MYIIVCLFCFRLEYINNRCIDYVLANIIDHRLRKSFRFNNMYFFNTNEIDFNDTSTSNHANNLIIVSFNL